MNSPLKALVLLISCLGVTAHAHDWAPSQALLDGVRHIESADGRYIVGDHGQSLGEYQLSEAAWLDVSSWRKSRGWAVHPYEDHVWNPKVSRAYAAGYLRILHARLESTLKRCPTSAEIYAAYNMGFASFARCQYRLAQANSTTAKKSLELQAKVADR